MLEAIKQADREGFLWLNGHHAEWLDVVMYWVSDRWIWIPFYLWLIYLIFRTYGRQGWVLLLGLVVATALADRISSGFFKPYFERLRPCHDPLLADRVHLLQAHCGGTYGFISSHAANTFALATYLWLAWRKKIPASALLFAWATLVSYSRIYAGVHFPLDVLTGGLLGVGLAFLCFRSVAWIEERYRPIKT
ncbi:undecaprenyl-diphosphatase [Catalinimonas alkaloidigena]|uniref:Undecaprenyl-diphosphatase n=1 Tax=Catalinimonas alkaloidigena TaxID=1075417 RepID=A0A1G8WNI3_9BACT|nr:phosphatase PAP2 family protein [Catalinimonas alkaloidigena]SDJ79721.1 undecaprenyl-diphosphatase [Catalinimonas alkaloidigena]